ncbi:MAG: hypothetical protein IJ769_11225 [Clostridia bacterium]|nr:hypothetical protein [Clostridia bacterium]
MEQTCPNCGRHCLASDLHCDRGRAYFGLPENGEGRQERRGHAAREHGHGHGAHDDALKAVRLLRECGHRLHHGMGDPAELIAPLTDRELETLEHLLEKCLNG